MIKKIDSIDIENVPAYETTQGDSFDWKATIKDGINANKVARIRVRISDRKWNLKIRQDFFQQSDSIWFLHVTSESTKLLKPGPHHMQFEIEYVDGGISTIGTVDLIVLPYGKTKEESNDL